MDILVQKINTHLTALLDDAQKRYRLGLLSNILFKYTKEFICRKGKRIRPLLYILSYQGYTPRTSYPRAKLYRSAASIELLHDFMLMHDDIIDRSELRRGKPTLHKLFDRGLRFPDKTKIGTDLAIVAGDITFALAIEALLDIDEDPARKERALRQLVQAAAYTGAGEFIDVVFGHETINRLTEDKIFLTYTLKTARYTFECPLVMGAILAGAPTKEIARLSEMGICAGQAFQIYDDFLDLFSDEKSIGKPVLADLNESKKTILVFKAYQKLPASQKKLFRQTLEKPHKTLADLQKIRQWIISTGSYETCAKIMNRLHGRATGICENLSIRSEQKKAILAVFEKFALSQIPAH